MTGTRTTSEFCYLIQSLKCCTLTLQQETQVWRIKSTTFPSNNGWSCSRAGMGTPDQLLLVSLSLLWLTFLEDFCCSCQLDSLLGKEQQSFANASRKQNRWKVIVTKKTYSRASNEEKPPLHTVLLWGTPSKCLVCSVLCAPAELNSSGSNCKWGSRTAFTIYMQTGNSVWLVTPTWDTTLSSSNQMFRAAWPCSFRSSFKYTTPDAYFEYTQCSIIVMLWPTPQSKSAGSKVARGQKSGHSLFLHFICSIEKTSWIQVP